MADETRTKMAEEELKVPEETGSESERTEGQPISAGERVEGTQHGFKRPMLPAKRAAKTVRAKPPGKAERTATTAPKPVTMTESRPDNRRRLLRTTEKHGKSLNPYQRTICPERPIGATKKNR